MHNSFAFLTIFALVFPSQAPAQSFVLRSQVAADPAEVKHLAFSSDGRFLVCSIDKGDFQLWELTAKKRIASLSTDKRLTGTKFAVAAGGKILACRILDGIQLWKLDDGRLIPNGKLSYVGLGWSMAFSADNKRLGIIGADTVVFDIDEKKRVAAFQPRVLLASTWSPDLRMLATGDYQDVDFYDTGTGKERMSFLDHRGNVLALGFDVDGNRLAVASCWASRMEGKTTTAVTIWDIVERRKILAVREFAGYTEAIAFGSKASEVFVVWQPDPIGATEFRMLDAATGELTTHHSFKTRADSPTSIALSQTGRVAAGFRDGTIRVWDFRGQK